MTAKRATKMGHAWAVIRRWTLDFWTWVPRGVIHLMDISKATRPFVFLAHNLALFAFLWRTAVAAMEDFSSEVTQCATLNVRLGTSVILWAGHVSSAPMTVSPATLQVLAWPVIQPMITDFSIFNRQDARPRVATLIITSRFVSDALWVVQVVKIWPSVIDAVQTTSWERMDYATRNACPDSSLIQLI